MIIESVRVKNFCGILDATLECDSLTALVGGNGCGKSTFLKAISVFYQPSPRITASDFYNDDITHPIEVTITFAGLGTQALELFKRYVRGDSLTVSRVLTMNGGKVAAKYHGIRLQHPEFTSVRVETSKVEQRKRFNDLRADNRFSSLPSARSAEEALAELEKYETAHPEECQPEADDGQFFGFNAVGAGYLGRFTRFLLIPAVRDAAADGLDSRGTPITELMDLVVRKALVNREDLKRLQDEASARYREIVDPSNLIELGQLQKTLTDTLQKYVPDAAINIEWSTASEIDIPMPQATVKLVEHSYPSIVTNAGHGLQRAFVLTMLQSLAAARSNQEQQVSEATGEIADSDSEVPDLVLAIEEPELFQHPPRQRHFASILYSLANDPIPGVAQKTQVIYTTHSAHFVGLDRFQQVRVCHKVDNGTDAPRITRVAQVTLDNIAKRLSGVSQGGGTGSQPTWEQLRPRLQTTMTPLINEGFFAEAVALVEGDEDRSAIITIADLRGLSLEEQGILVIPCNGKGNLRAPFVIFSQFGIKTYLIWDGDCSNPSEASNNKQFLRLLGQSEVDFPETQVNENFACFHCKLQETIRDEFGGSSYNNIMADCIANLGLRNREESQKNPIAIAHCIEQAYQQGLRSATLERIVEKILNMKAAGHCGG